MANIILVVGIVIAVAIVSTIIFFIVKIVHKKKLEESKKAEASLERLETEVGLGYLAKTELKIEEAEKVAQKSEASFELAEKSAEAEVKGDIGAEKAMEAVEEGAEAAWHEEEAEEAVSQIEKRSIGIEASVKKITKIIAEYSQKNTKNVLSEEKGAAIIHNILENIKNLDNNEINSQVSDHLKKYLDDLKPSLQQDLQIEQSKQELFEQLLKELENAITVMKISIKDAENELKKLQKVEKKTKIDFNKELKDFEVSLKAKSKQIDQMGRRKDVNPILTVKLIRERDTHFEQLESAKLLNKQLEETYNSINSVVTQIKILLKGILENKKAIKKYDLTLEMRKKQINRRIDDLKHELSLIEKISKTEIANAHELTLNLSGELKKYFHAYSKIFNEDLTFDSTVKEIILKNSVISQEISVFQQFAGKLTQSQKAIDSGIAALTELISSISIEKSKKNITAIVEKLKEAVNILSDEEKIENIMKNLAEIIKNKSSQLSGDLQIIVEEDKKLLAQIKEEEKSHSSHLGFIIGNIFRKINASKSDRFS